MEGATFRAAVEGTADDELARIGAEGLLIAVCGGKPTERDLLEAAATSEHAAHRTFSEWATDEPNDRASEVFAAVADREATHRERVLAAMDDAYEPVDGGALHTYLRGREGALVRVAAGMVGRGLVADRTHGQLASFFADAGDDTRAALFRELRTETVAGTDRGVALLETLCDSAADWADARGVAAYTVQVAVDDYADALDRASVDSEGDNRC